MTQFQDAVKRIVAMIRPGQVVSYGQIAAYIGLPRGARQVGWAMRQMDSGDGLPWWRVLNNAGQISIKGHPTASAQMQKEALEAEGAEVKNFALDMRRYRFKATAAQLKEFKLGDDYLKTISKYLSE